ncbi:hypothetical protein LPN04_31275 [Rugamonas sp. A1-17]|nr:hypothetical protein [Rugamonas sp. A1-17]
MNQENCNAAGANYSLQRLNAMWSVLSDVPIDEDGKTEDLFLHFDVGVPRGEIWHWFQDQNPAFNVAKMLGLTEQSE